MNITRIGIIGFGEVGKIFGAGLAALPSVATVSTWDKKGAQGTGMVEAALIPRIAETEEILNPVYYLASESFTTGITLVADGGLMAKR
jgi:NAD(P)-dependent dehydrogenase (short-subunit alcohol dehydrogenase family)